jgi:GT2 family glycosyltransferase
LEVEDIDYVQLIDGDCALQAGWIATAEVALETNPKLAVVCGRRRERAPEASVYNRLCDHEWDTPVGSAKACGGDALMRLAAFKAVGGYNPALIAGEEPDLCVRLRQAGWRIERLDAEMTWHDADMHRFAQWWRRSQRAGHAFAEGAALHGAPPERHWVVETRRALVWGAALPAIVVLGALVSPWMLAVLLAYPAQMLRLGLKDAMPGRWERAVFTVLGKFPEARGVLGYYLARLSGRKRGLIEYK